MMLRLKTLIGCLFLSSLVACGGGSGGGLERDPTSGGTDNGNGTKTERSIVLSLSGVDGAASDQLSSENPLTLSATVKDSNGNLVLNTLVTFTTSQVESVSFKDNDTGTASTGTSGTAVIDLIVGKKSGGVAIVASLSSSETATVALTSAGIADQSDQPASIEILTSASTIPSSGSDNIDVYVLIKDQNGILLEGVDVLISADASVNLIYPPSARTTGVDGKVKAQLSNGSDKTNREISISASVGQFTDATTVRITGSRIQNDDEKSIVLGESVSLSIFLVDSDGKGIPSEDLRIESPAGNAILPESPQTDLNGLAQVTIDGIQVGDDLIKIYALDDLVVGTFTLHVKEDNFKFDVTEIGDINVDALQPIALTWLSGGVPVVNSAVQLKISRGLVTDVNGNPITTLNTDSQGQVTAYVTSSFAGPATVSALGDKGNNENITTSLNFNFVAKSVASMTLDASPDIISPDQQTTITAVLRDSRSNLVKGKTVNFVIKNDQTNGNISNLSSVSDTNGRASIIYTAGSVTSDIDGVVIEASVQGVSSTISKDVKISVGGRAFDITFGTGREITPVDETRYEKTFAVFVTDAQSNPARNVNLSVKMRAVPLSKNGVYYKGYWDKADPFKNWFTVVTATCANEDQDDDGVLDKNDTVNEDTNNDGFLTPGILGSISFKGESVTDENGEALFAIRYPKSYANWASVEITVLAQSEGTESSQSQIYGLPIAASDTTDDESSPPENPFGSGNSCTDTL